MGHRLLILAGAIGVAALLAGCGGAGARNRIPSAATLAADYRGAPAPLKALYLRRNRLLAGGAAAFAAELRSLRGHPVVVNAWASWCPDCQAEFAIFQQVAPRYGRRVAFVGDDVGDGDGARWLAKHPLSFPSFSDRSWAIDRTISVAAGSYAPVTYFLNRSGELVYPHLGPYLSAASLEHDLRRYLHA